jgi:regulator of sigma E protease
MSFGDLFSSGAAIVVTLAILVVLVLVHELGHFIVARRFGVKVHEFGIGFPPRARVLGRRGDTLYTLNWLPLGGFVRLEGEDAGDRNDPRSFASQSLWRRSVILVAGVVMNLLVALVILTFVTAYADPSVTLRFGDATSGSLAASLDLRTGDTIEAIDGRRSSYFDGEDPTAALGDASRAVTLTVRHADGTVEDRTVTPDRGAGLRIGLVQDASPAAAAGLVAGDVIVAVDDRPVSFLGRAAASQYLRDHAGQQVTLTVLHPDGSSATVHATLRPPAEVTPERGALGVRFDPGSITAAPGPPVQRELGAALEKGVSRTIQALGLVLGAVASLIGSVATDPTQAPPVAGPVGIVFAVGSLLQSYPPVFLLWVTGLLSANVALVNILPFPPFDGGRIAVAVLQAAVGNRISASVERAVYLTGFVILMGLLAWITLFDVLRGSSFAP